MLTEPVLLTLGLMALLEASRGSDQSCLWPRLQRQIESNCLQFDIKMMNEFYGLFIGI